MMKRLASLLAAVWLCLATPAGADPASNFALLPLISAQVTTSQSGDGLAQIGFQSGSPPAPIDLTGISFDLQWHPANGGVPNPAVISLSAGQYLSNGGATGVLTLKIPRARLRTLPTGTYAASLVATLNGATSDLGVVTITHTAIGSSNVTALSTTQRNAATATSIGYVPGPQGQSAFQVAVANGYTGTQAQWLASLVGATGPPGNTYSIGTSPGTVAAGNDYRLQNAPQIDGAGNLSFLGGGRIGTYQNGKFTSTPDATTGDVSGASVQPEGSPLQVLLSKLLGRRKNVADFPGWDPTGTTDSTSAIQAAINALPATGGTVVMQCGSRAKISATLHIHNGSATQVSTRNGTRLEADCPIASYSVAAQFGFPAFQNRRSAELVWAGGSGTAMVQIDGGDGWGLKNILFDGGGVTGGVGLKVISAQNGDSGNLSFLYCPTSILSTTVPNILANDLPGGGLYHTDSLRNRWDGIFISMPAGGRGIVLDGSDATGGLSSDTDFNYFTTVQIADSGAAGSGQAIVFRVADGNIFNNVAFTLANPNSNAVVYDYSGPFNGILPSSNKLNHVDWGATPTTPVLVIDPSSVAKGTNAITGILPVNGGTSNPTVHSKIYESDDTLRVAGGKVYADTSLVTPLVEMPSGATQTVNLYFSGGWKFKANGQGYLIGYNATAGYVSHYITAVNSAGAGAAATLIEYLRIYQDGGVVFTGYTNASGGLTIPFGTPASATAACKQGEIRMDATYLYSCIATNSWRRVANGSAW